MATYAQILAVSFGPDYSGREADIGVTITDSDEVVQIARVTGFAEVLDSAGDPTTGSYKLTQEIDTDWGVLAASYDINGEAGVVAVETIANAASSSDVASAVADINAHTDSAIAAVDATTIANQVWTREPRTVTGTNLDDEVAAILARVQRIGDGVLMVNAPINLSGKANVVRRGYAYVTLAGGRALTFQVSGMDLTGAAVSLWDAVGSFVVGGSVASAGSADQTLTFELDEDVTRDLVPGLREWVIRAVYDTDGDGDPAEVGSFAVEVK